MAASAADGWQVDTATATTTATATAPGTGPAPATGTAIAVPERRRLGHRMSCLRCDVAWTGDKASSCWVCDGPGVTGPPPSLYRGTGS